MATDSKDTAYYSGGKMIGIGCDPVIRDPRELVVGTVVNISDLPEEPELPPGAIQIIPPVDPLKARVAQIEKDLATIARDIQDIWRMVKDMERG